MFDALQASLIEWKPISTVRGSGWPGLIAHKGVRRVLSPSD